MELQKWKVFKNIDSHFAADVTRAYLVGITSSDDPIWLEGRNEVLPWSGGVLVMKNGDVYFTTLTDDEYRQIKIKKDEKLVPNVPVKIDALCGQEIRDVQSGILHVTVLTTDGRVFQWGEICSNEERQVGVCELSFLSGSYKNEKERVIQIACGENHALALTAKGQVYSWGRDDDGQLGIKRDAHIHVAGPTHVSGLRWPISQIACGDWTSYALEVDGSVWCWGDVPYDVPGYGSEAYPVTPLRIRQLCNIKMIAAGSLHVLALSKEKMLYFWGQHASEEVVTTPRRMEVSNVESIGATRGCSISAFKTAEDKVHYWGFALGRYISEPVATKYRTMIELFASLDSPMMLGPIKFDLNRPMTEKLELIFNDSDTADVTFVVDERRIHGHKMLLKFRSDHFKRMFNNNWRENMENEVNITGFSYEGFLTFLFYLYTDRIEPMPQVAEKAIELFRLADYYGEEDLKRRCERQLKLLITEENFSQIYSASVLYNFKTLHEMALDLAIPNLNAVVQTDGYKSMPEELQKRLIRELPDEQGLVRLERKRAKYNE